MFIIHLPRAETAHWAGYRCALLKRTTWSEILMRTSEMQLSQLEISSRCKCETDENWESLQGMKVNIKTGGCSHGQPCPTEKPAWVFLAQVTTHMPIYNLLSRGCCSIMFNLSMWVAVCCWNSYNPMLLLVGCRCCPGPCYLELNASRASCRGCLPVLSGRLHGSSSVRNAWFEPISHEIRLILTSHVSTPLLPRTILCTHILTASNWDWLFFESC